ncbi:MAG: FapA family protein [Planctomycetota bacterium]|nr:FapA family protein [Planctomycetota bacterium]
MPDSQDESKSGIAGGGDGLEDAPPAIPGSMVTPGQVIPGGRIAVDNSTDALVLQVHVDQKALSAYLTLRSVSQSAQLDLESLVTEVTRTGLLFTEEELGHLREILAEFCEGRRPIERELVVQGLEPLKGEDGKIDWAIEYLEKKVLEADSRVDFRQKETIRNVRKGEKMLTIIPPERGLVGRDVFGKVLPAKSGVPIRITRGSNVHVEADGVTFVADADGRVTYDRNTLRVDPTIEVMEDLDYSVGNIDFTGFVHVHGGVLDGFSIKASQGIHVGGMVAAATLESDGDVALAGGMAGRGKGILKCKGTLTAKYLNQVTAEVGGDMTIYTEIHNSIVNCTGSIKVERGSIIGGEITALGSVSAPMIGSPMGVKTAIAAGVNYSVGEKLREIREVIRSCENTIAKFNERLAPFLQNKEQLASLDVQKLEIVRNFLIELQRQQQLLNEQREQERNIVSMEDQQVRKLVMVSRRLHAGVSVQIGSCRTNITDDLEGPLRLTPNEADGSVKIRGVDA